MTLKLLGVAAGLGLVAASPVLLGALVPALGVTVATQAALILHRVRRTRKAVTR